MKKPTLKQLENLDTTGTAIALCGYAPHGDIPSIHNRLNAARSEIQKLTSYLNEIKEQDPKHESLKEFQGDIDLWTRVITCGEQLLLSEQKN